MKLYSMFGNMKTRKYEVLSVHEIHLCVVCYKMINCTLEKHLKTHISSKNGLQNYEIYSHMNCKPNKKE